MKEQGKDNTENKTGKKGFSLELNFSFPLFGYILKRVLIFIPTLFIISLFTFILISAAPGDPAETMLNRGGNGGEGQASNKIATDKAYQDLRHKLGLDLPVFYFTMTNKAACDTLIKIPKKDHREILERMVYDYGNWEAISAYYKKLTAFELQVLQTPKDSTNANALIEVRNGVGKLYVNHKDVVLQTVFAGTKKELDKVPQLTALNASFNEVQASYERIKSEQTAWKRYIPTIHWNGPNNQYHRWLLGNAAWFSEETDPTKGKGFIRGDFGISFFSKRPVKNVIWDSLWVTMLISFLVIIIEYLVSIPVGVSAAVRKDSKFDTISTVILFILYSLPVFWIGTMAIFFLTSPDYIELFPPFGLGDTTWEDGFFVHIGDLAYHLTLPLIVASYASFAYMSRQMRGSMLTVLRQDYIRTAIAKGLPANKVYWRHAFRNSLFPVITLFASFFPALIGGSIILETLFTLPGLGQVTFMAVIQKDYPMILTNTMFAAILTLFGYLVTDILYAIVDPRVSYTKKV
jgi:peptide/nickel transport system permease protein